jgi:hypothetical protein
MHQLPEMPEVDAMARRRPGLQALNDEPDITENVAQIVLNIRSNRILSPPIQKMGRSGRRIAT